MKSILSLLAALTLSLLSTGCASTVTLSTATRTGIEISGGEAAQAGAQVGFERFEGYIAPGAYRQGKSETIFTNTYPTYALFEFQSGGLTADGANDPNGGGYIRQSFATGKAALRPNVKSAVRNDFAKLGGKLMTAESLAAGRQIVNLANRLAGDNPALTQDLINAVNTRLKPEPAVTNLNGVIRAVQSNANQNKSAELQQILNDLKL